MPRPVFFPHAAADERGSRLSLQGPGGVQGLLGVGKCLGKSRKVGERSPGRAQCPSKLFRKRLPERKKEEAEELGRGSMRQQDAREKPRGGLQSSPARLQASTKKARGGGVMIRRTGDTEGKGAETWQQLGEGGQRDTALLMEKVGGS